MKTLAKIAMIVLMSAGAWMMPQKAKAQFPGITFQVFYDQLSPYGAWVYDPGYGYVWIPDESAGFLPYGTGGHWVYTVYGWTWVSDYPWGWAPFHYGRWNYDPYYGWIWIPGNEWGPAWVSWRMCNGYYGWAPLGPGITIQMTFSPGFFIPEDRWMFVRDRDFDSPDLERHFVGRRDNHDLIRNSRAIQNTRTDNSRNVTYVTGPDARDVRSITGRDIKPLPVKEYTQPGRTIIEKDQIEIYRPPVSREEINGKKPTPVNVFQKNEIKGVSERSKGALVKPATIPNERTVVKEQTPPSGRTVTPKYDKDNKGKLNTNTVKQGGNVNSVPSREAGTINNEGKQLPPQRITPSNGNRSNGMNNQNRTVKPSNENKTRGQAIQQQNKTPQSVPKQVQEPRRENSSNPMVKEQKRTSEPSSVKKTNSENPGRRSF
jgi:hypothetical protein